MTGRKGSGSPAGAARDDASFVRGEGERRRSDTDSQEPPITTPNATAAPDSSRKPRDEELDAYGLTHPGSGGGRRGEQTSRLAVEMVTQDVTESARCYSVIIGRSVREAAT